MERSLELKKNGGCSSTKRIEIQRPNGTSPAKKDKKPEVMKKHDKKDGRR